MTAALATEPGTDAPRFFETPDNPAPPGGEVFWLKISESLRLRVALWRPASPRGTVMILAGRTETLEKYFETIGDLLARDFVVLIFDWRGQGASTRELADPRKGHISAFSDYLTDFAVILDEVESRCPRPWVLLAHSMGANIALHALHEWRSDFSCAVLGAPMLGIRLPAPRVVAVLAALVPPSLFVPNGKAHDPLAETFEINPVTQDPARFARNQAILTTHPEVALGAPTWGWLRAALLASEEIMAPGFLETIRTPILMLSAAREQIVENGAQAEAAARLPHCEHLVIEGAKHELLMETDAARAKVWAAFDRFVDAQLSAPAR